MANSTQYYLENIDPEDWPQQLVTCDTPGCVNEGLELQVPAIGQDVVCGGCGQHIIRQQQPGRG